jgi:hypothetical protein
MVKKPRPETCVRGQVVAAVAEAKLMRSCVISELQEPEIPPIAESSPNFGERQPQAIFWSISTTGCA